MSNVDPESLPPVLHVLQWNEMQDEASSPLILVVSREREVDVFALNEASQDVPTVVRIIRGQRCKTEQRLFQEWAAALQFPNYFGESWDALSDCITDLEWLPAERYAFFVTRIDEVLEGDDRAFRTFLNVVSSAIDTWRKQEAARPPAAFLRIVLHCEVDQEQAARKRLERTGVYVSLRRL